MLLYCHNYILSSTILMNINKNTLYNYYSNISPKKINWLWYPYIPFGKITIIQGDPGDGKSTFMLDIIARLTNGSSMPDGYLINQRYNVIYQCFEDDLSDTIKPRLESAGADCNKVSYIIDENQILNLDDERIETTIHQTNSKLLVLDPLQSFMQDGDLNSASKIRSTLNFLVKIAKKYNCAIVLIGHLNKSNSSKNIYRGLGSIDITAIARSVLLVEKNSDKGEYRYIYHIKSSLAKNGETLKFKISKNSKIKWIIDFKTNKKNKKYYKNIILKCLKNKPILSSEILKKLINEGISERSVNSLKKEMRITSIKINNQWHWRLPYDLSSLEDSND